MKHVGTRQKSSNKNKRCSIEGIKTSYLKYGDRVDEENSLNYRPVTIYHARSKIPRHLLKKKIKKMNDSTGKSNCRAQGWVSRSVCALNSTSFLGEGGFLNVLAVRLPRVGGATGHAGGRCGFCLNQQPPTFWFEVKAEPNCTCFPIFIFHPRLQWSSLQHI